MRKTVASGRSFHEANRRSWEAAARAGFGQVDRSREWRDCYRDPRIALIDKELEWLGDLSDKEVCVLGSGDNLVVFALTKLGARVTSVDISAEQLRIAEARAAELEIDVKFVQADVTDLGTLDDALFDVVYTGGHVAVWVSDLWQYYWEALRILKPSGLFLVNEYHPFRRIWREQRDALAPELSYFDRGPHVWNRPPDIPEVAEDSFPTYEFHWTVSEFLMAVMDAGADLLEVAEWGDAPEEWEVAPLAGLPQALLILAQKL